MLKVIRLNQSVSGPGKWGQISPAFLVHPKEKSRLKFSINLKNNILVLIISFQYKERRLTYIFGSRLVSLKRGNSQMKGKTGASLLINHSCLTKMWNQTRLTNSEVLLMDISIILGGIQ